VITVGVIVLSGIWYMIGGHRHYHGPRSNLHDPDMEDIHDGRTKKELVA